MLEYKCKEKKYKTKRKVKKVKTMTRREMFEAIVNGNITDEVVTMAKNEITKMDERNAKRKGKPSKNALANEPIKAQILEVLTDTPMVASEVAERVGVTTQKASALLRQIDGLTVTDVKVKGKGKVKGYALGDGHQYLEREVAI